jgi:hypothetical protein
MPLIIYLGVPAMTILTRDEYDAEELKKKFGKPSRIVEIISASGGKKMVRADNVVFIKEITTEELEASMAEIKKQREDPRDAQGRRMIQPVTRIPGGGRHN